MNIVQAHPAFFSSFKYYIPELKLASVNGNVNEDLVYNADLLIFSGGEDINPVIYGEKNKYSHFSVERDMVELEILRMGIALGKKLLGVCRGHQLINAHLGGKLVQDLRYDLKINHPGMHRLNELEDNSVAKKFFFGGVNSLHHQGVIKEGDGLFITSTYGKVIESTENDSIITVQWHPEFMEESHDFFDYVKEWSIKK